jgi:hypothetical protein
MEKNNKYLDPRIWQKKMNKLHNTKVTKNNALYLTIEIWKLLQKDELRKYGLKLFSCGQIISKNKRMPIVYGTHIGSDDCPLCKVFLNSAGQCGYDGYDTSLNCPLFNIRDNTSCDSLTKKEMKKDCSTKQIYSPWKNFIVKCNPKPMLKWLLKIKN